MPWEIIKRTEKEWAHASLDLVEEIARSESSVVFKIAASRINTSGKTDITIHAIWIAVKTDGSWGIQFRHNLGTPVIQKASQLTNGLWFNSTGLYH